MAAALERAIPETKIYSPVGLVQQFDRSITSELNFMIEADNAERFAQNFAGHPEVRFPKVYAQASRATCSRSSSSTGRRSTRRADGRRDRRSRRLAVGVIIKMIFEDGFFHADPHPGNIIILGTDDRAGHRPHRPRHGRAPLRPSSAIARST